jgi:hypothetical protein
MTAGVGSARQGRHSSFIIGHVFVLVLVVSFTLRRGSLKITGQLATKAILNTSVATPGTARRE